MLMEIRQGNRIFKKFKFSSRGIATESLAMVETLARHYKCDYIASRAISKAALNVASQKVIFFKTQKMKILRLNFKN